MRRLFLKNGFADLNDELDNRHNGAHEGAAAFRLARRCENVMGTLWFPAHYQEAKASHPLAARVGSLAPSGKPIEAALAAIGAEHKDALSSIGKGHNGSAETSDQDPAVRVEPKPSLLERLRRGWEKLKAM